MGKSKAITILLVLLAARLAPADLVPVSALSCNSGGSGAAAEAFNLPTGLAYSSRACPCIEPAGWAAEQHFLRTSPAPTGLNRMPIFGSPMGGTDHPGDHGRAARQIIELPPPPGGSTLTLSGLLTLGAVQMARSTRGVRLIGCVHLGHLPEWYHIDAGQIGHRVSSEFQIPSVPVQTVLTLPEKAEQFSGRRTRLDGRVRLQRKELLSLAPRSPPIDS